MSEYQDKAIRLVTKITLMRTDITDFQKKQILLKIAEKIIESAKF